MNILVNGEPREAEAGTTIAALLLTLGLSAEATVVERNRAIVERDRYAATAIEEGDTLELVQLVGGG